MVRSVQDILEIEKRPLAFDGIESTYGLIRRSRERHPDAQALSFFAQIADHATPVRWTYRQLFADITRAATMFRRLGVQRGDVVAYITPNLPETHIAMWGAETAGIAFAVNPLLDGAQMAELLRAAGARWLVTIGPQADEELWRRVGVAIAEDSAMAGVLVIDALLHLSNRPAATPLPPSLSNVPVLDFHAELARESGDLLGFAEPQSGDIASLFCTGGTTGLPKIARHTQANEIALALQLIAVVGDQLFAPGRTMLTALPLFHVNAQLGTGLTVFAGGGHVLLAPPAGYRAAGFVPRFWEVVEQHRVSSFSGVPTVYAGLLQAPRAGRDLSSLSAAICGAAPMPVDLFRKFEAATGLRILEAYGLTEGTCVSSMNPMDGESRVGSIGLRLPWQDMRVMRLDAEGAWLREADTDEVGAICISGPNVFPGYLNEAHNQGIWITTGDSAVPPRVWLNTGDLGRMDADGYFWLTGRKKELIIRGGHNIDPKSIEEVLAAHPLVALCAAIGRPDARAGEVPVAYVQLRAGVSASEEELLAYASAHITERAAVPKSITAMDLLPVTAVGKIFKPALIIREIESVVRQEAEQAAVTLDDLKVEQDPKLGLVVRYRLSSAATQDRALAFANALGKHIFRSVRLD